MKEKVYCARCEFYVEDNLCRHEKNLKYKDTPLKRVTIYGRAHTLNKRNRCKLFQSIN